MVFVDLPLFRFPGGSEQHVLGQHPFLGRVWGSGSCTSVIRLDQKRSTVWASHKKHEALYVGIQLHCGNVSFCCLRKYKMCILILK